MERLPASEWLHLAKRLPVGRSERVYHGRESRPNLVVYNNEAEWSAYCHRCHKAGSVSKRYVIVGAPADAKAPDMSPPRDCVPVLRAGEFSEYDAAVAEFLVRKHMVPSLLPPLAYSCTRKRIVLTAGEAVLGRDITELSNVKWVQYSGAPFVVLQGFKRAVVLVEDTFSAYKVKRACPDLWVIACLGTRLHPKLKLMLNDVAVLVMFDGDAAGYAGAAVVKRELPGRHVAICCAPAGLDPKDMELAHIRAHLENLV